MDCIIHRKEIYPVDSIIHLSNNRALIFMHFLEEVEPGRSFD